MSLDWQNRVDEIQSLYFRTGRGTCLWIACDPGTGNVSWGFNMLDYGMCHTIAGCSHVQRRDEDGVYVVDRITAVGTEERAAWDAVFGGHFKKLEADIRADMRYTLTLTNGICSKL
jgi:hypothetical protein